MTGFPHRPATDLLRGCILATALAVTPLALAQAEWEQVAESSDGTLTFAKTASIVAAGSWVAINVKRNYTTPQPSTKKGKTFLSSRTSYRVDCAQQRIAEREVRVFAGADLQGGEVQKYSSSDKNLIWQPAPPDTVLGEIVAFACKNPPAPAPAK
jgi:hypothetical protein